MKHFAATLLLIAVALPSSAQPVPASDTPGRLFMTPEKRHSLDRQRKLDIRDEEGGAAETMQFNGVVQRSSGNHSVWINQRMQYGEERQGIRLKPGQPGTAELGTDRNGSVQIRVGDTLNRSTLERQGLVPPDAVQSGKKR